MTVREICSVLEIGDGMKPTIDLSFGIAGVKFNPGNTIEMLAYGDFIVETFHVWEGGVNIVLKQQFVRRPA